jgi:hypothetical protein
VVTVVSAKQSQAGSHPAAKDAIAAYEPTEAERASMKAWTKHRLLDYPPLPPMKVEQKGNAANIGPGHADLGVGTALQMSAIAAAYPDYYTGTLSAIGNLSTTKRQVDAGKMDYLMAMIAGIRPRDQIESMLAVQMAAVHDATMEMAARMKRVDTIQQHDSAERSLNKLARTFTAQVEALKRYRSKGEQRVTVEHVTVNDGGQAIVGTVSAGGRGNAKIDD